MKRSVLLSIHGKKNLQSRALKFNHNITTSRKYTIFPCWKNHTIMNRHDHESFTLRSFSSAANTVATIPEAEKGSSSDQPQKTNNNNNTTTRMDQKDHLQPSKMNQTISYPIPSRSILSKDPHPSCSQQHVHCVFEKSFPITSNIPLTLEINTRNLNVEFCEGEQDSELRIEMYAHNCNEYSWYDLNNTPQGFFSDYKFEYLYRELTNTLRFNVHQAPLPPLYIRYKLYTYYAPGFFMPSFVAKYLDEKLIKYGTMKVYLPKHNKNSVRVETDIGNIIFRGIRNISNEVSVKSTFGTLLVSDDGISNVNHFHVNIQYGACYINHVNNVNDLSIHHRWSTEEDKGTSQHIASSTGITIDNIESNTNVKIQTLTSIDIELNQLNLAGNCQVDISCLMKGEEWEFTKKGIQVFVSNDTKTTSTNHKLPSSLTHSNNTNKLKIYSDANPIFIYFDKNSPNNYNVLASTRWSDVSFDSQHILYDGFLDVNQFGGIIVSRNDLKRLRELSSSESTTNNNQINESTSDSFSKTSTTAFSEDSIHPISGHITLFTKQGPIFMKQYVNDDDEESSVNSNTTDLIDKRIIIQKQQVEKYFVNLFGVEIAKKDLFLYSAFPIAIVILFAVTAYHLITLEKQSQLKESGTLVSMGNTGTIRAVQQREDMKGK
ncbi:hypothetical protein C9374_009893 [Naegleria lovaniensis]|uniref:Adhesin domain-containing protein n=1 Tax=Naegleria lovaniensis TaxID=51637 RepID=A0AA88GCY9_NAELO|nr:uncharacterized protein C9374_009893 [Naegleria lovaniensis]KAG2375270.1 hypothetical protein C9374_009893 [Naegleria lovaniensis]